MTCRPWSLRPGPPTNLGGPECSSLKLSEGALRLKACGKVCCVRQCLRPSLQNLAFLTLFSDAVTV